MFKAYLGCTDIISSALSPGLMKSSGVFSSGISYIISSGKGKCIMNNLTELNFSQILRIKQINKDRKLQYLPYLREILTYCIVTYEKH
ncbi:hypothetical protein DRF60_13995 [Chryseobacterium elymi]|uniref:Uncharacterized protein n=1 Tax=Chryseobacterium elymi TaxID=395936 RepID=A0A3D9DF65_9FLAO|nr:hypothetical protein DRF60_13995 [Chryseobacterium elymi]